MLDKESKKPEVQETARSEERESTRQVIESGRKAEIANETENRGGNTPSGNAYGLGKKDDKKDEKEDKEDKDSREERGHANSHGGKEETAVPAVVSPAPALTPTTPVAEQTPVVTPPVAVEPTPAVTPPVAAAPAVVPKNAQALEPVQVQGEVRNLTRAELMRRQRMRAELSSEDLLHERLKKCV